MKSTCKSNVGFNVQAYTFYSVTIQTYSSGFNQILWHLTCGLNDLIRDL